MHPLKLVEIKKSFGFLQSSPQILAERADLFDQKSVFVGHANVNIGKAIAAPFPLFLRFRTPPLDAVTVHVQTI